MPATLRPALTHVGITVKDLARMTRFYTEIMNLPISDRGHGFSMPMRSYFSAPVRPNIISSCSRQGVRWKHLGVLAVETPILDRLSEVLRDDALGAREVSDGSRDFEDAMIAACR